jgi:hypothetical protein
MDGRGAGLQCGRVARVHAEAVGALSVVLSWPSSAMAAAPLCPCSAVPESPLGPMALVAGVGAITGVALLKRRSERARTGRLRSMLARLSILFTLVLVVGALSLLYNGAASTACDCVNPTPTPTSTLPTGGSPSDTPAGSPSGSPSGSSSGSPHDSPSGSPSARPTAPPSAPGGGDATPPATPTPADSQSHVSGVIVGVPPTGYLRGDSPALLVISTGAVLTLAAVQLRRRRARRRRVRH